MFFKICTFFAAILFSFAASAQYVFLYADCNYRGTSQFFGVGRYSLDRTRIGMNQLSSLKVPKGLKVVLYTSREPGSGDKTRYSSDISCLDRDGWNNRANSMVIEYDNTSSGGGYNNGGYYQNNGVTLYQDCDYNGSSRTLGPGYHDANDLGIGNDQLSSIRVPRGYHITVYQDGGYRGRSTTFYNDVNCLSGDWNDKVSSVLIYRDNNSGGNRPGGGYGGGGNQNNNEVILYKDCDYRGGSQSLSPGSYDANSLGIGNDQLSAIRLPRGWSITVYEDGGFRGRSMTFYNSVPCLGGDWNDRVSSVRISRSGGGGYENNNNNNSSGMVTLYKDCDFRGSSRSLSAGYHDANDLGIGNDQLSSIRVPSGWYIRVYQDGGYRGRSTTFYRDENCLSSDWNDKVSSVFISRVGR